MRSARWRIRSSSASDEDNCQGTEVTITPGVNSSRPFSRSARLVVQQVLPPVPDDVLRDEDGDDVPRASPCRIALRSPDRLGDLPERRVDDLQRHRDLPVLPFPGQVGGVGGIDVDRHRLQESGRVARAKASARMVGRCSLDTSTIECTRLGSTRSSSSAAISLATRS